MSSRVFLVFAQAWALASNWQVATGSSDKPITTHGEFTNSQSVCSGEVYGYY
jgi:hypothetical protein